MTAPAPRRAWSVAMTIVVIAVVGVWMVSLRPQFLGGPTAIVVISGTSMEPNLHTGELVLVHRRDAYAVGDVVAYRVPEGRVGEGSVVIHRIVGGSAKAGFVMRGDNRRTDDQWRPTPSDILGREWHSVPVDGPVLGFVASPLGLATSAGLLAFLFVATGSRRSRQPGLAEEMPRWT
jgi:signal peptidase